MEVDKPAPPCAFLSAEWRNLLMLNYVIDADVLQPLVPNGTELDLWEGQAFGSVVGFRFLNTKVRGLPIPFHRNFDEVNLRFYVKRKHAGEWRKGVAFIKEIVPRRAIAFVARWIYNENYVRYPMRSSVQIPGTVRYEWKRCGVWEKLEAHAVGEPFLPSSDSKESFITEHYWGYAGQRDGSTVEYGVEHPPWRVWKCEAPRLTSDVTVLYGSKFAQYFSRPAESAFVAEGSPVVVRYGECITKL
jgi:uncharacterized protein YqjF (DUF2071 family)